MFMHGCMIRGYRDSKCLCRTVKYISSLVSGCCQGYDLRRKEICRKDPAEPLPGSAAGPGPIRQQT